MPVPAPVNDQPSPKRRILLIGWDAADWQHLDPLLAEGLLPTLAGLIARGVRANLCTLQPVISPMLWTSIATGKTADKHGVHGFSEPDPVNGGARAWSSVSRRTRAVWNILTLQGWRTNVAGWWASHPAETINGIAVSNAFGGTKQNAAGEWIVPPGCVHPPEMTARLAPMRMLPEEVTEEQILPFIPRAAEIDQEKDPRLIAFATVFSDCVSVQSVLTEIMEAAPWDFTAVYFDAIDHFAHQFMHFHPPRMDAAPEREFELYREVMRSAYRFHDMMLARQLELAGPDVTVILCSDHGFQSRHLRPPGTPREPAGPTAWHRDLGILVMAGPGIRQGAVIYGATLLDITPTILTLAGLPCGADMDGKPLLEAFEEPAAPPRIPTWDDLPGHCGMHSPGYRWEDGGATRGLLQQFAALGYMDLPADDEAASTSAALEIRYNLAQVHLSTGRPDQAVVLLEELLRERAWENRFIHQLANAYARSGRFTAALALLDKASTGRWDLLAPPLRLIAARACMGLGRSEEALRHLDRAIPRPPSPAMLAERGQLYIALRRHDLALSVFRESLELDPENAASLRGLATVHLHRRENETAAMRALESIRLVHQQPAAHYSLGLALARMGRIDDARQALEQSIQMAPGSPAAHRVLAALHRAAGGDMLAVLHRQEARRLTRERIQRARAVQTLAGSEGIFPELPPPDERSRRIAEARSLPSEKPAGPSAPSGKTFVIVSGLPRSGTSLMMQMLAAGGLPPLTDGERTADIDNPEGYFEWEPVKKLAPHSTLLDSPGLDRMALKVVSPLLPRLPRHHSYRILFMGRPVEEIARSQQRMIRERRTTGMPGTIAEIAASLEGHRAAVLGWLAARSNALPVLEVDFPSLVAHPAPWIEKIAAFLGSELLPHPECMSAAVRPALHRERQNEK